MLKYLAIFIIVIPSIFSYTNAQNQIQKTAPKIGLCLSGGGAKGLAHIGLLKLIDSLGIKVDYITGTSMGSIVGGLYASGYSGNQIDSLVHTIDWNTILSENVPMNEINIDEKDEYGRYIAELAVNKKGISFTGFIEGQTLLNLLTHLTRHVNHVRDFSKLPIPYKCMAVDIEAFESVVLDSGNLALAMRASMSIPTVFKPVKINNRLYVDGGLISNFPVEEVRKMGADIVIGSYTGGRLKKENEMNFFSTLLIQSSTFYGIQTAQEEIKKCDIFNNLTDKMKEYEPGDFSNSEMILNKGINLAYDVLPQLVELANNLKTFNALQVKHDLNIKPRNVKIHDVIINTPNSAEASDFIKKRVSIQDGDSTNSYKISNVIKSIYATRFVQKAHYELEQNENDSNAYNLYFQLKEEDKWRFKTALHYDSELGAGIILNLTGRNVSGKNTRFFATIDLAQDFKMRVNYRKYIRSSQLSFNAQILTERTLFKIENINYEQSDELNNQFRQFTTGLNWNILRNAGLYSGLYIEYTNLFPRFESEFFIPSAIKSLKSNIFGYQNRFNLNTLDHPFFAKKGINLLLEHRLNLSAIERLQLQDTTATGTSELIQVANIYSKIQTQLKVLLPVSKKISLLANINSGYTSHIRPIAFTFDNSTTNTPEYIDIFTDFYFIGGNIQRARVNAIPFSGVKENGQQASNFTTFQLGIQYEAIHNLYITPSVNTFFSASSFNKHYFNYLSQTFLKTQLLVTSDNNYYNSFFTYALNIGYRTPLGPIILNVSKASSSNKLRTFLSIGYNF